MIKNFFGIESPSKELVNDIENIAFGLKTASITMNEAREIMYKKEETVKSWKKVTLYETKPFLNSLTGNHITLKIEKYMESEE